MSIVLKNKQVPRLYTEIRNIHCEKCRQPNVFSKDDNSIIEIEPMYIFTAKNLIVLFHIETK